MLVRMSRRPQAPGDLAGRARRPGRARRGAPRAMLALALAATVNGALLVPDAQAAPGAPRTGIIQTRYVSTDSPLQLDVLALGRVNANVIALRVRLTNVGGGNPNISTVFSNSSDNGGHSGLDVGGRFTDLALIDGQDMKAYYPLVSSENGSCLCSGWPTGGNDLFATPPGFSFESTILYPAIPSYVHSVDIASNVLVPFNNIPIAGGYQLQGGDPDPNTASDQHYVLGLTARSDSLDNSHSVDDHGGKIDVRLNADVLFKFDKSNLTSKASGLLHKVAQRIDKSKATTIKIDGYTDSKGSDGYNQKLSERRAASVLTALKKLVTRTGISYKSAGHGESDPVATNSTAAGRQKNRRVTVTLGS